LFEVSLPVRPPHQPGPWAFDPTSQCRWVWVCVRACACARARAHTHTSASCMKDARLMRKKKCTIPLEPESRVGELLSWEPASRGDLIALTVRVAGATVVNGVVGHSCGFVRCWTALDSPKCAKSQDKADFDPLDESYDISQPAGRHLPYLGRKLNRAQVARSEFGTPPHAPPVPAHAGGCSIIWDVTWVGLSRARREARRCVGVTRPCNGRKSH
jgi:hypothetical protein